ncbi:MAG: SIS domain-containing protein, partial [Bacteroidia bacterium]
MQNLKQHFTEAQDILAQFIANEKNFEAIAQAGALMVDALKNEKKILSCGNGGSLCDAMHFAEELTGRYRDDRRPFAAI